MTQFSQKQLLIGGLIVLVLIGAIAWYFYDRIPKTDETFTEEYALTLSDYDGKPISLSEFKRELLVVHAWASWCPYCKDELVNLGTLKDTYGDKIEILAVNRAEPLTDARTFSDPLQLSAKMHFLLDPEDAFYKSIEGYAMPETIFINKKGEVVYHQHGPMQMDDVRTKIDTLISPR